MEFLERLLGIKRRKQEALLAEFGIEGELRRQLVGPELKEASVVKVENDQFLEILKSGGYDQVLSYLVNFSDTHLCHDLYLDIGEGVQIKTGVASIDYSQERNLFSDLHEMSFMYDPEASKREWGVYKIVEA